VLREVFPRQQVVETEYPVKEEGRNLDRCLPHLEAEGLGLLDDQDSAVR
jgi:hypothetical protein